MIGERVTLVVLTFDRRDEVLRTLHRLALAAEDAPIVVVDNGSTDGTADALHERHPALRVVRLPRNIGAAARNAGARAATTPYVAFCDDDTWWLPGSLAIAATALDAHPELAVVTARVLVGEARRDDPTNARMAASPLPNALGVDGSEILGLLAGACMVRREAFLAAGGYEPRLFLGGEERLLAVDLATAGWHMAYLPGAVVCHHPSPARDRATRRRLDARNALWFAWLRRPAWPALRATAAWWRALPRDESRARAAREALSGLPWIARARRVVPAHVERMLRTIEAFYPNDGHAADVRTLAARAAERCDNRATAPPRERATGETAP
jgi:GT2 family glycosyltransferase